MADDAIDARIREGIDAVYAAFKQPAPRVIEGCPCCIDTRGVDVLLATPLQQLTGEQLYRYVSGAYLTLGSDRDFNYLLPRILETAIEDPMGSINPEIILGKLKYAGWQNWPADQHRAVADLIGTWFEQVLARDLSEAGEGWISIEAESVLCGAALAGLPLSPFLARLQEPDAAPFVAELKTRFPRRLSGFWKDAPTGWSEVSAFLSDGEA